MNIDERESSKKRSKIIQRCIPEDLERIILLHVPANTLYNVMRHVCQRWYNLIQSPYFISSHLKNSTIGLIINPQRHDRSIYYIHSSNYINKPTCDVEVKELNLYCVPRVKASCNGLVFVLLGTYVYDSRCLSYVANLVTKQYLLLPLFPVGIRNGKVYFAYASTSKVYKVFYAGKRQYILTIGVDKFWRKLDILHDLSLPLPSVTLNGFVYWIQKKENPFLLCFDMETETFSQILLPPLFHDDKTWKNSYFGRTTKEFYGILTMGSSICLYKHVDNYSFEIWLMKDPETGHGEWERLWYISFTNEISNISKLLKSCEIKWISPCGWLRNEELLVLGTRYGLVLYNVITGEYDTHEKLVMEPSTSFTFSHVESLVPMDNLSLVEHARKISISRLSANSKNIMRAEFEEYW